MLRVFVDSLSESSNTEEKNLNIQVLPLKTIVSNNDALLKLIALIEHYLKNGDKVIIVTLSSKLTLSYRTLSSIFDNRENMKVINSYLPESGLSLIVKEIVKYQDESLDFIEQKVDKLIDMVSLFYYSLVGN